MTDRYWRLFFVGVIGCELLVCGYIGYWATRTMAEVPGVRIVPRPEQSISSQAAPLYSPDSLRDIATMQLRGSLTPPPPPVRNTTPRLNRRPPRIDIKLVGTVIETDRTRAILMDAGGHIILRGVGETLEGPNDDMVVEAIEPKQVVLRVDDRTVTLQIEQEAR